MRTTENQNKVIDAIIDILNGWKTCPDILSEDNEDKIGEKLFTLNQESILHLYVEDEEYIATAIYNLMMAIARTEDKQLQALRDRRVEILYYNIIDLDGAASEIKFLWRKKHEVGVSAARWTPDTISLMKATGAEHCLRSVYDMLKGFKSTNEIK